MVFRSEHIVDLGAPVNDHEGIRILFQCLFRLGKRRGITVPDIRVQAVGNGVHAVVPDFVAQQHVHGSIKKVRKLHDHGQFRDGKPGFPFVDSAGGDAQRLGQLLLGQRPLLPERPDVFGKCQFHFCRLLSDFSGIVPERNRKRNILSILTGY